MPRAEWSRGRGSCGEPYTTIDLVLMLQLPLHQVQMQFTLSADHLLTGLPVVAQLHRWVLLLDLQYGAVQLFLLTGIGGLDGESDTRSREVDGHQFHLLSRGVQRVRGGGVLQLHGGTDVTGCESFDGFPLLAVHDEQLADAFHCAGVVVHQFGAFLHLAAHHLEVGDPAGAGFVHGLEGEQDR